MACWKVITHLGNATKTLALIRFADRHETTATGARLNVTSCQYRIKLMPHLMSRNILVDWEFQ